MGEELLLVVKNGVAIVTINRPGQRNAVTYEMWKRLGVVMGELADDPKVRVVILRGAGTEAFSAGADIAEFEEQRRNSAMAITYHAAVEEAFKAVANLPKPTIAMVAGFCVGGGLELAISTDLRIAADNSRYGMPTAKLGIVMPHWEMSRLIRLVGAGRAMDMVLTARLVEADEALRIGLISRLVPLAEIEQYTGRVASEIAAYAPLSHRWHKQFLETVLRTPDLDGLTPDEAKLPFVCFDTEDFQEGRRAFLEKRKPEFRGR
ncbi:MAG: enoyl-CoA hydratase-related protein [Candidatus Methylomirabilales bacterium]